MPCYYTGSAEGDARLSAEESHKAATKTTRMLCRLCKRLDAKGKSKLMPKGVAKWWAKHKKIDEGEG